MKGRAVWLGGAISAIVLVSGCVQSGGSMSANPVYCRGPGGAYSTRDRCPAGDPLISQAEYRESSERQQAAIMASAPVRRDMQAACAAYVTSRARGRTNVPALLKTVGAMRLTKDEFETTAAYEARVSGAVERLRNTMAAQTGGDPVVVDIPLASSAAKYDADRGVLEIAGGVVRTTTLNRGGRYQTVIVTDKLDHDISTYTGQNAYGAKTEVIKIRDRQAGIVVDETSQSSQSGYWPHQNFKASLPLSPDRAKAAKGNLRALVMGDLREPFIVRGNDYLTPTFQAPIDRTTETIAAVLQPRCSVIYDQATREVYWP